MKNKLIGIFVCILIISISTIGVGAQVTITDKQLEKEFSTNEDISFHKIFFANYVAAIWNKEDIEEIRYYHIPSQYYPIPFKQPYVFIKVIGKCFSILMQDMPSLEEYYRVKDQRVELKMTFMIGEMFEDVWDGKERFHIRNDADHYGIKPTIFNLKITPL